MYKTWERAKNLFFGHATPKLPPATLLREKFERYQESIMSVQIFGGLGPGLGESVNPFDPNWQEAQKVVRLQDLIDKENAHAVEIYKQTAANVKAQNNQAVSYGLPIKTLSAPPFKKVLSFDGKSVVESTELVCAPISVNPDVEIAPKPSEFPVSATPAVDRTDRLISMLMVIKQQLDRIESKLP